MSIPRSVSQEILFGRSPRLKVFVSSKMRGDPLKDERRIAVSAIGSTSVGNAWCWENHAHAGEYCAEEVCLGHAETSDVLVLILAEDLTPIVGREYVRAGRRRAQRCVYVKEGVTRTPDVQRFIERHRKRGGITRNFRNASELRSFIVEDINFHVVNSTRHQQLARMREAGPGRLLVHSLLRRARR